MHQKAIVREEKIDKFLDNLSWYFSSKQGQPTGLYATIGRIEINLAQFNENAEKFIKSVENTGKSSEKLTKALNKITLAGVLVAIAGIVVAIANLTFELYKFSIGM